MVRRVNKSRWEIFKIKAEIWFRYLSRRRGFLLRCLLCWGIGCLTLMNDESSSYDQRFQLRGDQRASSDIVMITIRQSDFANVYDRRTNYIGNIDQITDITDSFFWNKKIWSELLQKVLQQNPKAVGVTLYFGDNIGTVKLSREEEKLFKDPRIIWSSTTNSLERVLKPAFANADQTNVGSNELRRDEDGVVRRLPPATGDLPHLTEKLVGVSIPKMSTRHIINYRGNARVFNQYTLSEILYDEIPSKAFANKIILIGAETTSSPQFITPVGSLSRTEILAQITDNLSRNRWIVRIGFIWYAFAMLLLTAFCVFIITTYPQSVALVFILWTATLITALSAWVFDSFYIWIPALSPFVLLAATWIIFIGYQATKIERQNFRLQQEQEYLQELEQLKNNFVSLISHDLKTPIAKIQAIVDRLLRQTPEGELMQDLRSLRGSSEELNRYIQSILKVLRVESRDFKLNREVADINEIIEEALQQLTPLAREKSIWVQTNLEPMFSLEFDITLLKEVIINLVENAIKYTPSGGFIQVTSQEVDDWVIVTVKDSGEGIQPQDVERVWGKFTRGSDQDLRTKGSGLGLYLVKYFIELHGGKVNLESQVGVGTSVSFRLPLQEDAPEINSEGGLS